MTPKVSNPPFSFILPLAYLGGLIDGEGSFLSHFVETANRWYPEVYFTITLLDTAEWKQILDYGMSTYGGIWYRYRDIYLTWRVTKREELLRFLNQIIPHLRIKRADAEKARRFLKKWPLYKDKGKKTREEAVAIYETLSV